MAAPKTPDAKPEPAKPQHPDEGEAEGVSTSSTAAAEAVAEAMSVAMNALEHAETIVRETAQHAGLPLDPDPGEPKADKNPLNDMITAAVKMMETGSSGAASAAATSMRELAAAHVHAMGLYNALAQQQADAIASNAATIATIARLLGDGPIIVKALAQPGQGGDLAERLRGIVDTIVAQAAQVANPPAAAETPKA